MPRSEPRRTGTPVAAAGTAPVLIWDLLARPTTPCGGRCFAATTARERARGGGGRDRRLPFGGGVGCAWMAERMVVVLGGGVGGMSAAHELAERRFEATVLRAAGRGRQGAQLSRSPAAAAAATRPARGTRLPLLPGLLPPPADVCDGSSSRTSRAACSTTSSPPSASRSSRRWQRVVAPAHFPKHARGARAGLQLAPQLRHRGRRPARRAALLHRAAVAAVDEL